MILDFHTHLGDIWPVYTGVRLTAEAAPPHYLMLSSRSIEAAEQMFYRQVPPMWTPGFVKHALLTLWRRPRTVQGMTRPNLLHDMQTYQITHSVVLPIEYTDGIARSAQLLDACQDTPQLLPFCSVHPKDGEKLQKLQRYMRQGAYGLKLHPNFQRVRPDDPDVLALCEAYAAYGRPLIVHSGLTGREGRLQAAKKLAAIEFMEPIPSNFPEMPVVLAHAGITQYQAAIALAQTYPNVFLEISGQPARHIRQAIQTVGAQRLLFGTDWPFWPQRLALQAVRQATSADPAATRRILHDNAAALLQVRNSQDFEVKQRDEI